MNILADILSSKARAEIFRVLFGINNNEFHLREIERRTGYAIQTVSREIKNLTKIELINKRIDGNRTYYSANKNHPLFTNIQGLVLKTSGLIDILKSSLNNINTIYFAFVFGSVASGNIKEQSDIDLFIIGDIGLRETSKLLKGKSNIIGREINVHTFTVQEYLSRQYKNDHFITKIIASSKLMIIGNENELNKLGK